jgi:hypothetical protein
MQAGRLQYHAHPRGPGGAAAKSGHRWRPRTERTSCPTTDRLYLIAPGVRVLRLHADDPPPSEEPEPAPADEDAPDPAEVPTELGLR